MLRLSFLGFNPLGSGYDGRGKIDVGADQTFGSLDSLGAFRVIRRHLRTSKQRPIDLRLTGYSFGGWTALQLAHFLSATYQSNFSIRLGLVDPIPTFRRRMALRTPIFAWPPVRWETFARMPRSTTLAVNYFQTRGLIARYNGDGFRLPMRAGWFRSLPLEGFENHDISGEVSEGAGHIDVCEKYATTVARRTFGDD